MKLDYFTSGVLAVLGPLCLFVHVQVSALIMEQKSIQKENFNLVFATRIHLGQQAVPTPQDQLNQNVLSFLTLAQSSGALRSAIAVDAAEKIPGYDLVDAVQKAVTNAHSVLEKSFDESHICNVIPTTPWGQFIPALNALVRWACVSCPGAERIAFLSLETHATSDAIINLCQHVILSDTLVAGACLPGHEHYDSSTFTTDGIVVELTGRTSPWNTLAVWNLKPLAVTGFLLLADGLHTQEDGSPGAAGIEEFSTILIHQKISSGPCKAKLVKMITQGLNWEENFQDEERKKWHEFKMQTKFTRAEQHRKILGGLRGSVLHL
jgi:hypothetical protein